MEAISNQGVIVEHKSIISAESYRSSTSPLDRILLRVRMYIEYPFRLMLASIFDRGPRIYVVTTNTFFAPLIALLFSRQNQKVVHLVWDLYPDVLVNNDAEVDSNFLLLLVSKLVSVIFNRSAANVFLGVRLRAHAESRFPMVSNPHVIPVGADASLFLEKQFTVSDSNEPVDILYCGNMGAMHDTDTIISAIDIISNQVDLKASFNLTFHASGPNYPKFKDDISARSGHVTDNIYLNSGLSNLAWQNRMLKAQVALVTMKPGSEKLVMPSKVYSALVAGQAILAICPSDSDLARLIIENNCGWVVEPGSHAQWLAAIQEITTNRSLLFSRQKNSYLIGHSKFSAEAVSIEWLKLFVSLKG